MSRRFRKYALYAIGEVALIIFGIMIALQIDNWNTDRQQRALLKSYLQSIALDMREDAKELERLSAIRQTRTVDALRAFMLVDRPNHTYQIPEIYFFNRVAGEAAENIYFRSDSSGYEALKSSEVISLMQGIDIERVLSRYYEQVDLVADLEKRHNESINQFELQYVTSFPDEVSQWMFISPRALPPELFDALQPIFSKIINGASVRQMISLQLRGSFLVLEYERLHRLGRILGQMVESGQYALTDPEIGSLLERGVTPDRGDYQRIIENGVLATQYYNVSGVAEAFEPVFDFRFLEPFEDGLRVSYPGSRSWAAIFLQIWGLDDDRTSLDYSEYDKLVLELRSETPSDTVIVHIKDAFLSDFKAPDSVALDLSNEWKTYEIDLTDFPNTNLKHLITPLGFSFERRPQSVHIRSARYVKSQ